MKGQGRVHPVRAAIRQALDNPALVVQTRAESREQVVNQFRLFLNILYALLSVSVLIGALGVVNTMTMAVLERTREIALLRAIGLDRRQAATLLRLESMIISLLVAVAGTPGRHGALTADVHRSGGLARSTRP